MFKKSNILCCGGHPLLNPSAFSSSLPPHASFSWRSYATAHDFSGKDLSWPTGSSFTPYDVFKQERGAPYSKSRFYDLVKIYHPDRPCNGHPLCRDISPEVRLHRYRLVVTAHEILSDPTKRAAYDLSGAGWSHHSPRSHGPTPSWARTGSSDYGPIFTNGTWEDWERWYNRHGEKQRQVVDHRTFTSLVILLTLLGGAVQASWISQYSTGYEDRLREINEESTRFLVGRRENTVKQTGSSDAKVQHFLIRRDPTGFGLKEEEQPVYQQVLNPRKSSVPAGTVYIIGLYRLPMRFQAI
ncbi:hypothetical protein ASPWEDRAFT_49316 [Aspergillus wentii DTO 134E9]|uniref:J domain-containing protein n=1 Tax=Aspergillus wentii DTO 134E9 TaxID=1073089 RepID=A0A1L9RWH8_ASPWE|nr:uncharacterized protein ASPWEDRAFT_49316 [Aspergillus wentii DTO 134E9]OJJ39289.1 hypothetical protein ASPWEDRAFT_49316 [Aspergillus wentii DTO 134E9]